MPLRLDRLYYQRMTDRAGVALGMAVLCGVLLSGCTVPVHGWVGLQRGEDDSLYVVTRMCGESIDGATIYALAAGPDTETVARVEFVHPSVESVTAIASIGDLETDVAYRLYGWTTSNTSSAAGPSFELDDIIALEPGTVLAVDLDVGANNMNAFAADVFNSMVIAHCNE